MLKVKNLLIAASVLVLLAGALTLFPPSAGHTQTADLEGFPVKVVNGDTKPVPTSVRGTATVSGIVNLATGAKVGIDPAGNTVTVASLPNVTLGAGSKVGIDPANSSVTISNTPTVNLAAGSKLTLDPANTSVSISNTPTVALSSTANTVRVNNTATTPAFIRNADDARQVFQASATVTVLNGATSATARVTTVPAGKRLVIEQITAIGAISLIGSGGIASLQTSVDNRQVRHFINLNLQAFSAFSSFNARPVGNQLTRIYADPGTNVDAFVNLDNSVGTSDVLQVSVSGYLVDFP